MNLPDSIDVAAVRSALVGTRFARGLQHFGLVNSTNAMLVEAAAAGAPEGTVFVADEQTAGRGRGGHSWHSASGEGLYVSALVTPRLDLRNALLLSLMTGLAAWQAIHEVTGLAVDLRWPNDLMLTRSDGCARKCGGILVETAVKPGDDAALRYAVIGIGINVHHLAFPEKLSSVATSLQLESSLPVFRAPILISLLRLLDLKLIDFERGGSNDQRLFTEFEERSTWVRGKRVSVSEQGGYTGVTAGLDERGFLLVESDDGVQRTVLSGGVRETE